MANRIDADSEEAVRGETLEFLAMRLLVALETMVKQNRGAGTRAVRQRKQRNTRDLEPALDQTFVSNDRRIAPPRQRLLRFAKALRFNDRNSFGRKSPSRRISLPSK